MQNEKSYRFKSVDLRRAAVEVRIGSFGENDLLLVKGFGHCVRLGPFLYCFKGHPLCPKGEEEGVI
jgi:hypothetical protein